MRDIFRGKTTQSPKWIIGYLNEDCNEKLSYIRELELGFSGNFQEVDYDSVGKFTGKYFKKQLIFEGDIFKEEIENDEGDTYNYFAAIWIPELGRFLWLSKMEYFDYQSIPDYIETLDNGDFDFEDISNRKVFYVGTMFDNPNFTNYTNDFFE